MGTEDGGLQAVVGRATAEELRGLLIALEGHVVDVASVQASLAKLRRTPSTKPSSTPTSPSPAGSADPAPPPPTPTPTPTAPPGRACTPSSPPPATKRARCGDGPPCAAGVSTPLGTETPGPRAAPEATPPTDIPASTQAAAAAVAAAAEASVPPQGARGASWREKQRQKAAKAAENGAGGGGGGSKKLKKDRDFDHSRWRKRAVAVQLMYEGGNYAGFCSQSEGNEDTVEKRLFHALSTTKLVEDITTGDNYSRCGRTDRGVSALGNVITVSMRSKFPKHIPDADLPMTPLGSLWVNPPKPDLEETPDGAAQPAGARDDSAAIMPDRPVDNGAAKAATGVLCVPGNGGTPEIPAAGVAAEHAGKRANESPCNDAGSQAMATSARCEGPRGCSSEEPPPREERVNEDRAGGGDGGGGRSNGSNSKKKKKEKRKGRMGGGNGGGGPATSGEVTEIDYCGILNRVLPRDVRALAWAPVTEGFSARFSCSDRTYRYFFMARDMDIEAMDEAASKIVGNHDFRNLCKIDVANVSNFVRHIKYASVKPVPSASADYAGTEYYRICVFEVCGQAFLWHMVRCLMSVLFMVGKGLESPDVMSFLVDMERCPGKPHYDMAPDGPLLLHGCRFRSLEFQYTPENLYCLQAHLETLWEEAAIKAARLLNNLEYLAGVRVSAKDVDAFAAFKRALKGPSTEHYSVVDHGERGRRREKEQQQQQGGSGVERPTPCEERGGAVANSAEELTWREALCRLREMGLGPGQVLGRKGHMPMEKRQQGLHYSELVDGLGGKKRDRLNRHLAMKAAGTESGETEAFYNAAATQGIPIDKKNAAAPPHL
eukprot:g7426.t1